MSLPSGSHLGRYEIVGLLGVGGMGEVYRARDTQLHREVALKILPESAAGLASAEGRFEREARAIASVNHPSICAIHDVGLDGGRRFLVMELLDGETLQQRLLRGPLPVHELVDTAIALADALQAAHAREIIHRDLKPSNIFLTSRGQPKILDFGLAKAADSADVSTRAADDFITGKGTAVGTAAYMSPEQIRGEPLDGRTDVFSLGLVLYEMATAGRAFSGSTGAAVAASILRDEPVPVGSLRAGVPSELEHTLVKALEKDKDLRYQSAADLRADLKRVKKQLSGEAAVAAVVPARQPGTSTPATDVGANVAQTHPPSSSDTALLGAILSRHRAWAVVAAVAVLVAATVAVWLATGRATPEALGTFANLQIQPLTFDGDAVLGTISPDGRFVVYLKTGRGLRVRQISGERDIELVAHDRFARISSLTVTPDNSFVDVVAVTAGKVLPDVWRIPLLGGNPRLILHDVVSAIGWSPDGNTMAFVRAEERTAGLTVVTADREGANQRALVTRRPPKMFYGELTWFVGRPPSRPAWSTDGARLVLTGAASNTPGDVSELVVVDVATGTEASSVPLQGTWAEVASLDDHRLLLVGGDGAEWLGLWVSDLAGERRARVTREFGFFANISVTTDGTTAVAKRFVRSSGIWVSSASGSDAEVTVPLSDAGAAYPRLDVNGGLTYLAFRGDGVPALYHLPRGGSTPAQIVDRTNVPFGGNRSFDVSADGRTVVYTQVEHPRGLYRVRNDGSERVRVVEADVAFPRLTADGQMVLFARSSPGLYSVALSGGPVRQLTDRVIGTQISVSPDGSRVLFSTDRPGIMALCELPDCTNLRELPLRSVAWTPGGGGVAYAQDGTTIMEQPLDGGPPRVLARLTGTEPVINVSWSPDGSRLVTSRGRHPNDLVLIKGLR